jgi:hypothetical protein
MTPRHIAEERREQRGMHRSAGEHFHLRNAIPPDQSADRQLGPVDHAPSSRPNDPQVTRRTGDPRDLASLMAQSRSRIDIGVSPRVSSGRHPTEHCITE